MRRAVPTLLLALAVSAPAFAGADTHLDRLKARIEEKRRLEWRNALLKQEASFAATPAPYILVDPVSREIEFRVRGKGHKTYRALSIDIYKPDGSRALPREIATLLPAPLEVAEKAGGPLEIKPPSPASDPNAGDPNAGPTRSDAGILGVDAPLEYDVDLGDGVRMEIRTQKPETRWDRIRATFAGLAAAVGGWFGGPSAPEGAPRVTVRISFDEATTKAFYYSVLPGEHFQFVPAAPPPVSLVASLSPPPRPAPAAPGKKKAAPPAARN